MRADEREEEASSGCQNPSCTVQRRGQSNILRVNHSVQRLNQTLLTKLDRVQFILTRFHVVHAAYLPLFLALPNKFSSAILFCWFSISERSNFGASRLIEPLVACREEQNSSQYRVVSFKMGSAYRDISVPAMPDGPETEGGDEYLLPPILHDCDAAYIFRPWLQVRYRPAFENSQQL